MASQSTPELTFKRTAPNSATCNALTDLLRAEMAAHHATVRVKITDDAGTNRPNTLPADTLCYVASTISDSTFPGQAERSRKSDDGSRAADDNEVDDEAKQDKTACAMICILVHHPQSGSPASQGLPTDQRTGELKRVIVRPGMRGMGIGSRLNAYVEDQARREGFTYLVCETLQSATDAQKFYVRNGWRPRSTFGGYDAGESVIYEKWLTS